MKKLLILLMLSSVLLGNSGLPVWPEQTPEFVFARVSLSNRESWMYWPDYWPNMPPWKHDYPESDEYFISLLHELTGIRVKPDSYKIVELSSPEVFNYPFLYLSEPGFLALNEKEIANLGEYIRRGGFIMADDFRQAGYLRGGPEELDVLRAYLKRAVPEREFVRLDIRHPVFHSFFELDSLNMKAPYGDFVPQFWGMSDERGRLQIIANYNNDIGDFWKYLDEGDKPLGDSTTSIRMGINYVVYSMSH